MASRLASILLAGFALVTTARAELIVHFNDQGLSSLNYNGTELLHNGVFQPAQVLLTDAKGKDVTLAGKTQQTFDAKTGTCSLQAPWGTMKCVYLPQGDTLKIRITVVNTSPNTISIFEAAPLEVTFPTQPRGMAWDRKFEIVGNNFDDITALPADYGTGVLVACNDKVGEPLHFGFTSPIGVNTYRIRMTTEVWNSTDDPPIPPGTTKEFDFSLRFAKPGTSLNAIAGDLMEKLVSEFPFQLNWPDRRPLGMISLATQIHQTPKNPRGWFNDPRLDVVSEKGRKNFAKRLLTEAKYHLSILKSMNAQGMIVWNIEGEEFPNIDYVGDPLMLPKLAPEMDAAADAYFAVFRKAGIRTGICIRPSRIVPGWDGKTKWTHDQMGFDYIAEMSKKIDYAQKRWGCTLFYVDSSVHYFFQRDGKVSDRLISATEWKRLAKMHPDVLLIPEFPTTATWSCAAPYRELRVHTFGGFAATPDYTLAIYPKAFSVIVPMEGPIKERHNDLVAGVARGDILLFRAFFRDDDWNRPIREIYNEAQKRKPKLMKTDSGPSTKNVVLVHGIHDTAQKMQRMAAWLTADGFQPFTPALSPADGSVGLDQLAVQLRTSIDAHLGPTTPFSLVGFSMGGIVSRYYVQRLGGADRVRHFITISAPNHGTAIAWLQNKPGVRQMRPGSDFLNALNADAAMLDRTHFTSIWTPLDLMIIPASSSKMPVGKNVSLFSIAHPLMVSQRNSLCLIAERLRE